jgi:hypothetical protein
VRFVVSGIVRFWAGYPRRIMLRVYTVGHGAAVNVTLVT